MQGIIWEGAKIFVLEAGGVKLYADETIDHLGSGEVVLQEENHVVVGHENPSGSMHQLEYWMDQKCEKRQFLYLPKLLVSTNAPRKNIKGEPW